MSFIRLDRDKFENLTLELNSSKTFASSSNPIRRGDSPYTGSVYLYADRSEVFRDTDPEQQHRTQFFGADSLPQLYDEISDNLKKAKEDGTSISRYDTRASSNPAADPPPAPPCALVPNLR